MQDRHRLSAASLAHEGLLPLVPDRVPGSLWRVDRNHVGLYGSGGAAPVHPGLHVGHGHWELGGEY